MPSRVQSPVSSVRPVELSDPMICYIHSSTYINVLLKYMLFSSAVIVRIVQALYYFTNVYRLYLVYISNFFKYSDFSASR